ncbi:MAG: hypothetical protein AAGA92_06800 [Planctomycetota bacterium]
MAHRTPLICTLAALLLMGSAAGSRAAAPADTLFPSKTRGFVSVGDIAELGENWQRTQLGQMVRDDAMRPFVNDIKRQMERKVGSFRDKLGIELEDLKDVAAGELGVGLVERESERAAVVLTVDVTGRQGRVDALLAKIDRQLKARKATVSTEALGETQLTVYLVPPKTAERTATQAVYFVHDDILCASDNVYEARELYRRLAGNAGGGLNEVVAYRETMNRCASESQGVEPELRWFADPFGYARASRSLTPGKKRRGKDYVSILESQGFDAITGAGGYVNMMVDDLEIVHRTAVYAPPIGKGADKYKLAMRIMEFPNGQQMKPHNWIPAEVASHRTFNCDLQNAFRYFDTLFDAIVGYEGAFDNVLEGFEEDAYGPQIDVEKAFVKHLGRRITLLSDYELPITTKSERLLLAVEVNDPAAVSAAVKKFMDQDPNANRREFQGNVVWEITTPEDDVPNLDIGSSGLDLLEPEQPAAGGLGGNASELGSAVAVANGHLFIASHLEFLERVLDQNQPEQLTGSGDFRKVDAALDRLMPGQGSVRTFVRTDQAYRSTYELLRQGKMPESETLLGRMLNRLLTPPEDEDEGVLREQKIDAESLPAFEQVRRYFGPAGTAVRSDGDGWFISGATLGKAPAQARQDSSSRARTGTFR